MSRSEKSILNECLVEISKDPETLVWRNNTGQAWQGERDDSPLGTFIKVTPGMVILRNARPINFGLVGSGDAIGITARRPLCVETKTEVGNQSTFQRSFQRAWEALGGIYVLSRDPAKVLQQIHNEVGKTTQKS